MHKKNMMNQCKSQCRQTENSIDQTMKLMQDAKQSGDTAKMRAAMNQAEKNLAAMKGHMNMCMREMNMMQNMHGMMSGQGQMQSPNRAK